MPNYARSQSNYWQPLATFGLIVLILYVAEPVIVPLVLAAMLAFVLTPVVSAIQRRGLGRLPAVFLTLLLTFGILTAVGWEVATQIHSLARDLPRHRREIDAKITGLKGVGGGVFVNLLRMVREIGNEERPEDRTVDVVSSELPPSETVVIARPEPPSSFEKVSDVVSPILEPLGQAGLIVVLVVFMLIKREDLRNRVIGLLGHGRLTGTTRVLVDAAERLSRYLLTQLLINIGFGIAFCLALLFAGVPYALLWGFLAVIFRFVPYVGSWAAVALPLVLAFGVSPGWTQPLLVLAVFSLLELVTANVIEPLLFSHGTGVSPIALLIAAAFWSWVWGPIGLVLSTPLTVCLVVLGQQVPQLRFVALALGDTPPLESSVGYYQRLLAHDEPEAAQVAFDHVRAQGRDSVFDNVLLPALALARRDRIRAGLTAEDEALVLRATGQIIERLDGARVEGQPGTLAAANHEAAAGGRAGDAAGGGAGASLATSAARPTIVGWPAQNESEELVLAMLAGLLAEDGFDAEIVSTRALPVEVERRVEMKKAALVYIAVLPPGGVLQAAYLCRRLRKRFPDLPIVVGYMGRHRQFDKMLVKLRRAGASYVNTSLAQSRTQIRALVSADQAARVQEVANGT